MRLIFGFILSALEPPPKTCRVLFPRECPPKATKIWKISIPRNFLKLPKSSGFYYRERSARETNISRILITRDNHAKDFHEAMRKRTKLQGGGVCTESRTQAARHRFIGEYICSYLLFNMIFFIINIYRIRYLDFVLISKLISQIIQSISSLPFPRRLICKTDERPPHRRKVSSRRGNPLSQLSTGALIIRVECYGRGYYNPDKEPPKIV